MLFQTIVLVSIAAFIGISNSAGIGGGSMINVLLITGLDYSAKESILISYIFLMGGGLAATITGAKKFSASGKRLIDYNLVMITLPMMISGAVFGVMINHLISQLIITFLFIILILNLIHTSYIRLKEQTQPTGQKPQQQQIQIKPQILEDTDIRQSFQMNQRLSQILNQQNALIPKSKLKLLAQIFFYTIVIILCRGGNSFDSVIGLQSCGIGSYLLVITHLLLSYMYCKSMAMQNFELDNQKEKLGYVFANNNQKMSFEKMNQAMLNGFIAGVLSGTAAIGGGMVLVPIWLKAGIQKDIVVNSTAPLIFISSSVSFFIGVLLGQYDSISEILLYLLLGFGGSYVVKKFVIYITEKYGLKKLVYVLLLILMVLSLIVFLPLQFFKFQADPQEFMDFGIFC